jgi:hypothetical protein
MASGTIIRLGSFMASTIASPVSVETTTLHQLKGTSLQKKYNMGRHHWQNTSEVNNTLKILP